MADPFQGLPPELGADYQSALRKRAIMEALLQRSMQPVQAPQVKGRFEVPISPLQIAAQMFGAHSARRGLEGSDEEMRGIGQRYNTGLQGEFDKYRRTSQGTPEIAVPPDEAGGGPGQPAVPGNPRLAVEQALMSQYAPMQKFGQAAFQQMAPKTVGRSLIDPAAPPGSPPIAVDTAWQAEQQTALEERREVRRQRMQELELRLRSDRLNAEDKADLQRELAQLRIDAAREARGMAAALRQPPAPSIRDIIDPLDPSRLISVDTRVYNEGKYRAGDKSGVVGVAGKEPSAAARTATQKTGRETVESIVTELGTLFDQLARDRAIVDPDKGGVSNLSAAIQSSGVGQFTGNVFGTQSQSARNSINQRRLMLVNAIRQATGASARSLDSNVELKLNLQAATDPQIDVKANRAALKWLSENYGLGKADSGGKSGEWSVVK
jgi:hypothetical protein